MKAEVREVPAVAYPVGRSPQLAAVLIVLWLFGGAVVLCAFAGLGGGRSLIGWRIALLLSALLLSGFSLWSFWCAQIKRRLIFDGDQWLLEGEVAMGFPGEPAQVVIAFDGQRCMLLRWPAVPRESKQVKWLWAEAHSDPRRWHLLRCALYSPANRSTRKITGGVI